MSCSLFEFLEYPDLAPPQLMSQIYLFICVLLATYFCLNWFKFDFWHLQPRVQTSMVIHRLLSCTVTYKISFLGSVLLSSHVDGNLLQSRSYFFL